MHRAIEPFKKFVTVTGPRAWMFTPLLGWSLTPAVAVHRVPLRYEFAYGGPGFAPNPLGIGYVDSRKLDNRSVIPAPQLLTDDAVRLVFGKDYRDAEVTSSYEAPLVTRTNNEITVSDEPDFWTPERKAIFLGQP